ncbi:MAG TPA: low temperature requirement protein A [Mycobacteriales bacterium]|nr:low temperature requirement protein A [Mycobacteriales bacterium]
MTGAVRVPWRRPLTGRDPGEEHRASTPLELLFDLSFVVAVSVAAAELHHGIAEDHVAGSIGRYLMVFFAIWWAWMNFTWFASAYDTDDAAYRLLTLVQIAGVLVLAAGVHDAFEQEDFTLVTIGYVVMRVPLVVQWLRAARDDPERRRVARRYALGVTVVQAGWVLRLALPPTPGLAGFFVLVAADVAVPIWAERAGPMTRWHPGHIAERYGLFTLIVLGEAILAATTAIQAGFSAGAGSAALLGVAAGGLLLVFGLWWVYFARSAGEALRATPGLSFLWGYGHYLVFAAVGAFGGGLEVAVETVLHEAHAGSRTAAFSVAVPVAVTLLVVGALQVRLAAGPAVLARDAAAAVLVLLAALVSPLGLSVLLMGVVAGGLVVAEIAAPEAGDWADPR